MAIVTISRGTFGGGQALAKRLAEKLGYSCVSREEIIRRATEFYGVPESDLVAALDEPPSLWQRLMGRRTEYLVLLQATLCEHARDGNLVYHGLVGHLLLPDISHVIRVRVVADMETRIGIAVQERGLTRGEASAQIQRVDKERADWIRFLFDVEWDDARLYDAVLNLSRMSIAGACETIARMTELEDFRPTADSSKAMDDLAVASRVSAALAMDPRTAGVGLRVAADAGVVTVSGVALSDSVSVAVPQVVGSVAGVKHVRNEVAVAPYYIAADQM